MIVVLKKLRVSETVSETIEPDVLKITYASLLISIFNIRVLTYEHFRLYLVKILVMYKRIDTVA